MPTYYSHMENRENGKLAAIQDYAESRLDEIKAEIGALKDEARIMEFVVAQCIGSVCQTCRGERTVTYYPAGTSPGQGARSSIPCPSCRGDESRKAKQALDKQYGR
jgi:hypothetical protein